MTRAQEISRLWKPVRSKERFRPNCGMLESIIASLPPLYRIDSLTSIDWRNAHGRTQPLPWVSASKELKTRLLRARHLLQRKICDGLDT